MKFKAHQTAFHVGSRPVSVRYVELSMTSLIRAKRAPDPTSALLEAVYDAGQNDENPLQGYYSVSPGDVIEIPSLFGGGRHRVASVGFERLDDADPLLTIQQAEDAIRRATR